MNQDDALGKAVDALWARQQMGRRLGVSPETQSILNTAYDAVYGVWGPIYEVRRDREIERGTR